MTCRSSLRSLGTSRQHAESTIHQIKYLVIIIVLNLADLVADMLLEVCRCYLQAEAQCRRAPCAVRSAAWEADPERVYGHSHRQAKTRPSRLSVRATVHRSRRLSCSCGTFSCKSVRLLATDRQTDAVLAANRAD